MPAYADKHYESSKNELFFVRSRLIDFERIDTTTHNIEISLQAADACLVSVRFALIFFLA